MSERILPSGLRAVTRAMDDLAIAVVHDLVATRSYSGEESAAVGVFAKHAHALGMHVEIDEAGNGHATRAEVTRQGGVELKDSRKIREIVLLGHIDTVPGDVPCVLRDGVLHGRGSVDAKGPLATMLVAAARAKLPADVGVRVIAAVGEETAVSPGARFVVTRMRPAACIIGEPSGWTGVTLGYKGRLVMHVTMTRAGAHTAGPEASACDALVHAWQACVAHVQKLNAELSGAFETIQASLRSLRAESDGLCDCATLSAGFRLPRWMLPDELELAMRGVIDANSLVATVAITAEGHERAYATDRNDAVVRALSGAIREAGERPHPKLKTGTADLNVVGPVWQCPIAAYGPGDSALDHTPGEHLVIDEYLRAIGVLTRAVESLASELVADS